MGSPEDEYDPEVRSILPRLKDARSVDDVQQIVHEEFVRWFGDDIAGPADAYADLASGAWSAYERFRAV